MFKCALVLVFVCKPKANKDCNSSPKTISSCDFNHLSQRTLVQRKLRLNFILVPCCLTTNFIFILIIYHTLTNLFSTKLRILNCFEIKGSSNRRIHDFKHGGYLRSTIHCNLDQLLSKERNYRLLISSFRSLSLRHKTLSTNIEIEEDF